MTSIVSGGGASAQFTDLSDIQLQQQTKTLNVQQKDTINSVGTGQTLAINEKEIYAAPVGRAALPPPGETKATTQTDIVNGMAELKNTMNASIDERGSVFSNEIEKQAVFNGALSNLVDGLTEEQLSGLAYQPEMSADEVRQEVMFASLHPEMEVPENVRVLANQLHASALAQAQAQLGPEWQPVSLAWIQDATVILTMQGSFANELLKEPGLTKEETAQLHFAMENPDAASYLSPKLQAIFGKIMNKIVGAAQKDFGIPSNWQFPSNKESVLGPTNMFDTKFSQALGEEIDKGMSASEAALLETLHYNPEADVPNAAALREKLAVIEGKVLEDLQETMGLPPGYRPAPGTEGHEEGLNDIYQNIFNQNLNQYSPPLTAKEKALIREAQGDLSPSALPPRLLEAANAIKNMTIGQVIELQGLPKNWTPKVTAISDTSQSEYSNPIFEKTMAMLGEFQTIGEKTVNSLPEGEIKNTYMAFLSVVGETLAKLADVLATSQIAQGRVSRNLTSIRLEQELEKIKKQQKMLEEMKEKQEKGGFMGFLMKAMTWIVNIVIAVLCPPLAIATMIDAAKQGQDFGSFDIMKQSFSMANRILGAPLGSWVVILGATVLTMLTGPIGVLMITIPLVVDTAFGGAVFLTNFFMCIGIPQPAAGIIAMIIGLILAIIIEVIVFILLEVLTAGLATPIIAAIIVAEIAVFVGRLGTLVLKAVTTATRIVLNIIEAVTKSARLIKILKTIIAAFRASIEAIVDTATAVSRSITRAQKAMSNLKNVIEEVVSETAKKAKPQFLRQAGESPKSMDDILEEAAEGIANAKDEFRNSAKPFKSEKTLTERVEDWTAVREARVEQLSEMRGALKSLDAAQDAKNADRIKDAGDRLDESIADVAKFDKDLANHLKAHKDAHIASGEYDIAKGNLQTAKAYVKEIDGDLAATMEEKAAARQVVKEAENSLEMAKIKADKTWTALQSASHEGWGSYIFRLPNTAANSFGVLTSLITMNGSIAQGQIAMLKAEFAAYATEIDYFLKLIKDLITRLLDSISKFGEDFATIGKEIKHLYQSNSQTMSSLSMAG